MVSYFCQKAYTKGRELNLTADENFDRALKMADEKDQELEVLLVVSLYQTNLLLYIIYRSLNKTWIFLIDIFR